MLEPFDKYGRMDVDAFMDSFRPYLEANRRTTNTVFQVSLNPSPEDRLTDGQFRDIAQEYMERMGYGNQPYIVFKHKDISREHLHIVSLRVDEQGRKINDSHEYDQSMSNSRYRPSCGRACAITNVRPTESFAPCWNVSMSRLKNVREPSTAGIMPE